MERTLVLAKPDAVTRGLVGEIVSRLERKGLKLVAMKMVWMDREMAERHYAVHKGKSFFNGLVEYITSLPVVAMVWEGPSAVASVRSLMGATDPVQAVPGTIRGDLALDISANLVHGSDSVASAEKEIAVFFGPGEVYGWKRPGEEFVPGK